MHAPSVAVPVSDAILTGPSLTFTTEGPQSPCLMRMRGGTPEKRRGTTRNDGKRRETTELQGGQNDLRRATGHTVPQKGTGFQFLTC